MLLNKNIINAGNNKMTGGWFVFIMAIVILSLYTYVNRYRVLTYYTFTSLPHRL